MFSLNISSCSNSNTNSSGCLDFINEIYPVEDLDKYDFDITEGLDFYLSKFNGSSIKGNKNESYQMMFYSSHNLGKLIRIESTTKGASISVICIEHVDAGYYCEEGDIGIDSTDWNSFKSMIYEFNYWTENQVEINNDYLDGAGFILEGNRPQAEKCGKKSYNIIIRGNPEYDKIAALCEKIIIFENMMRPSE